MIKRRICVVTSTRAEYGLLVPLLEEIQTRRELELQLVVTGTHLSPQFSMTIDAIESDGIPIARRVEILAPGDDAIAAARTIAAAVEKLSVVFSEIKPDILVLLGDRYEMLSAATAATLCDLPIAHIHGGELTEGAFDDAIRHAITKLAHLHFAAAEPYRQRIIQMGENPDYVFTVGAPALDNLRNLELMDQDEIQTELALPLTSPVLLITYHPVTRGADAGGASALIGALERFPEATCIFTGVNADPGHGKVDHTIRDFVDRHPDTARLYGSLGRHRYLSLMKQADAVVGNSSSGVIEAPAVGTPTVNIGTRQQGRLRVPTIIDCAETPDAIAKAIARALADGRAAPGGHCLLGDGFAARRMADLLTSVDTEGLTAKAFRDIPITLAAATDPVTIIAEIGVNHNGSVETARALIDAALNAGADIVKFQSFHADALTTTSAPKAAYQTRKVGVEISQHQMLKALELSEDAQRDLQAYCESRKIAFLSTPFDMESLEFLTHDLGLRRIKIGSGDLTNAPLLLAAARHGCGVILSTGMATINEIEQALSVLAFGYTDDARAPGRSAFDRAYLSPAGKAALKDKVALLHCMTEYPAPASQLNIRAMDALSARFGLAVGYSDHSQGPSAAIAAVARGARIIEKHITLDRTMDGPDHEASMDPDAFTAMVAAIREVEVMLGDGKKFPATAELANKEIARKSLIAARAIVKGERFTEENLTVKRPETGISAQQYYDWIGQTALRDFSADEVIS